MSEVSTNEVRQGDCMDVVKDIPDESIHAVVTDPPYGLNFMPDVTNGWDDFEPKEYQEWCEKWARECLRVLKPGGHMLAFSGNRTHHRLFTGVEDAGFEIRDTLTWHYGSGFPKASDISKTIDKRADAEREVVGKGEYFDRQPDGLQGANVTDFKENEGESYGSNGYVTAPATDDAKKWDGWKTGLKPSTEFVVMARKPYDGATVDSVLEHGTGALNIEACRIGEDKIKTNGWRQSDGDGMMQKNVDAGVYSDTDYNGGTHEGRYPSNLIFDELAAEQLDADVGETAGQGIGGQGQNKGQEIDNDIYGDGYIRSDVGHDDTGGPSRYFYTSKATKAERTLDGKIDNAHPTVKPGDLMQWLVKLVTAENQIVLDPFCGSGTTLRAAKDLNRQFIGIERQAKWADVARVRAGLTPEDPSIVRDDAGQSGLEAYKVTQ